MNYSNAQILAAVVSDWSRPAISKLAIDKLFAMPQAQMLQQSIINSGLVGANYRLSTDLMPFASNIVNSFIEPILEMYFGKVKDKALPALAHGIVETAMMQPKFSILDGLVTFEQDDMIELKDLLDKNMPLVETERYQIKK